MSSVETKEELSLLSLPDELLYSCLARISRLYYPTLSLVSKRFRSLVASPELYKVRSLLGRTESCLYVCIRYYEGMHRWFTLCRKPDHQTLTNDINNKSSGYVLAAIPVPLSTPQDRFVAVGYNIYNIYRSSSISILDCRSHTWCELAPSPGKDMLSLYPAIAVDQKIYVPGTCKDSDSNTSKNVVQVFDTKTGTFDPVPIPCREIQGEFYPCCARIDGKFHVKNGHMVAYDSKEGRWDPVEVVGKYVYIGSYFEIENVLYSGYNGDFRWYDSQKRMWIELKGLVGLPQFTSYSRIKLVDYGGKMAVFWQEDRIVGVVKDIMIWCAEITLERRSNYEIWGKIEWFDCVLTIHKYSDFVKALAVTV